jgi:hypothetical protein
MTAPDRLPQVLAGKKALKYLTRKGYKAKKGNNSLLCRIFDTKELVSREDAAY